MRRGWPRCLALLGSLLVGSATQGDAAEYGFSSFPLGSNAFGAGITPPPGIYVTEVFGSYEASISRPVPFGRVVLNAGATVDAFVAGTNFLYVRQSKVLGGNLGFALTLPVGHLDLDASLAGPLGLVSISRSTEGWGFGDIIPRAQIGWQHGTFFHTLYVQAVAPTGRWQPGFSPIIGLHRPGVDTGWAFTLTDPGQKLQLSGAAGVTFNFENTATDYRTGNEFHFEWAAGLEFAPGLLIGVVGYDYRQLTGDSGSGAVLGPFKGTVDAVGPGLSYTTLIGTTPVILNVRHYREYNVENRWDGHSTQFYGTIRF
jgi:hypothetical protein